MQAIHILIQAVKMTTPNDDDDYDKKDALHDEMGLVYRAAANGVMVLPERMQEDFFNAFTAWILEKCVGCEKDEAGEWQDCEWQREIILTLHELWAGFAYEEPEK